MLCILVLFSLLQLSSSIINCRISCKRCKEKIDHSELMEVYCAMCFECKERRREWLQGPPNVNIIKSREPNHVPTKHYDFDDCYSSMCEDPCDDQPQRLTGTEPTTTTTTTTTSTTQRPCRPKPKCNIPYALPVLPLLPMCSICPVKSIPTAAVLDEHTKQVSKESMYLYLGVPKNLLNELKLENKV